MQKIFWCFSWFWIWSLAFAESPAISMLLSLINSPFIREPAGYVDMTVCLDDAVNKEIAKKVSAEGFIGKFSRDCSKEFFYSQNLKGNIVFVLDLNCPCAPEFLRKATEKNLFNRPKRWIFLNWTRGGDEEIKEEFYEEKLEDIQPWVISQGFHIDSRCLYMTKNNRVLEIFRTGTEEPLQIILRAHLEGEHLQWIPDNRYILRMNLNNATIRAGLVITNNDSYNHLEKDIYINKHIDAITKSNYHMFKHIIEGLNASVVIKYTDNWGIPLEKGNWSGLSGFFVKKEIDIGANSLFFTSQRLGFCEYIALTTPTKSYLIFRQPPLSYMSNIFTLPFSPVVWLSCIGLLVLCGILWRIALYIEGPLFQYERITWSDIVLGILGAVCQQGSERESRNISGRIISLMIFLAVMFLYTSYSASIVALLQSQSTSIVTLKDLYESGLGIGAEDISYNHYYLKKLTDPVSKAIWENRLDVKGKKSGFMTAEEGIKKMRKGLFAFQIESNTGYQLIQETFLEDEKCGLSAITYMNQIDPYQGCVRGSPYTDQFKVMYRKIKEFGIQNRIYKQFYLSKPECVGSGTNFVSVGIIDFYPALFVLIVGFGFSSFTFIMEIIYKKYIKKNIGHVTYIK